MARVHGVTDNQSELGELRQGSQLFPVTIVVIRGLVTKVKIDPIETIKLIIYISVNVELIIILHSLFFGFTCTF